MKNGVLSNFTRSHISCARVRSGYEINVQRDMEPLVKKETFQKQFDRDYKKAQQLQKDFEQVWKQSRYK